MTNTLKPSALTLKSVVTTNRHAAIDAVVTAIQEKKDFAVVYTGGAWEIKFDEVEDQGGLEREFTDL